MRFLLTAFFFFLLGCTSSPAVEKNSADSAQSNKNRAMEENALRLIFSKVKGKSNAVFDKDKILIGDSTIALKIVTEFAIPKEDKWIHSAAFTTSYNFGKAESITIGSVGIGSNSSEAQEICIQEWFATFGIAFTSMLQDSSSVVVAASKVFPGYMGIRGNLPPNTWLKGDDKMHTIIISKINTRISQAAGIITPVDIKLMIKNGKLIDGECWLNNRPSTELLNDLKQLDWPSSKEGFLFKQFYLVKKITN